MLNRKHLITAAAGLALGVLATNASAVGNTYTMTDPQEITAFASGYDIAKVVFTLDNNDALTIELFPYGVPGDADGDGDPNASSDPNIIDGPGVGSLERLAIGMVCDYDVNGCTPNFNVTYTNNTLTTSPAVAGLAFALLPDRYVLTISSITAVKQAVLGYVPATVTFGAFNFSASYRDGQPDDFAPNRDAATNALVCERVDLTPPVVQAPGTATIGYWKNHPTAWPASCDVSLPGSVQDPAVFAMNVLEAPVKGDKTVALAKQLVAAMLNVCVGNDSSCVSDTVAASQAWLTNYPVFSGQKSWLGADSYQLTLDDYNNGKLCAPHRAD